VSQCYVRMRDWFEALKWTNIYISNHPEIQYGYVRKWEILIYGNGEIDNSRKVLIEGMEHTDEKFVSQRGWLEVYTGNYQNAIKILVSDSTANYYLQQAFIYNITGEKQKSISTYKMAQRYYENLILIEPQNPEHFSQLGIALAGLGNKAKAIQMGLKAVDLLPLKSEHLLQAEQMILNLSYIYIMTGELEKAITQLEFLLSIPSQLTVWRLRLDPIFDPLRNELKFKELLIKSG